MEMPQYFIWAFQVQFPAPACLSQIGIQNLIKFKYAFRGADQKLSKNSKIPKGGGVPKQKSKGPQLKMETILR